jgi:hypothetical protein
MANDLVYSATSVTKIATNKPKKAGFHSKALRNVAVMGNGGGFRALGVLPVIGLIAAMVPRAFAGDGDYEGPIGVTGIFNGNVTTGCSYDPMTHSAKRTIDDIVVPGSVGKYPLKMTRYYNSRAHYYALTAIGLGPGWAHEY